MQRTINFAKKMNPHIANFMITIPFPGTELYDLIDREGNFLIEISEGVEKGFYGNEVFYELKGMHKELVIRYFKRAYKEFYFRPKKIFELLFKVRSLSELKWIISAGLSILNSILLKNP